MDDKHEGAVWQLCALWTDALRDGRHVPLRRRWPELAEALDAVVDSTGNGEEVRTA